MIVQFKTIKSDLQESYDRDINAELNGVQSVEFVREKDYMADIFIELDEVIDFEEARTYLNDKVYKTVFVRVTEDVFLRNLVIDADDFKKIIENHRGCRIRTAEEILKQLSNESYTTGI